MHKVRWTSSWMRRSSLRATLRMWRGTQNPPLADSLFKTAKRYRPYSLRRRVRRLPFLSPPNTRGMARQVALPMIVSIRTPSRECGAPPGAPPRQACAVWAYLRTFSLRRRAALSGGRSSKPPSLYRDCHHFWRPLRQRLRTAATAPVSQLLAGGPVLATGRSPGAARVLGGAFISRPRAPHPAPSSDAS